MFSVSGIEGHKACNQRQGARFTRARAAMRLCTPIHRASRLGIFKGIDRVLQFVRRRRRKGGPRRFANPGVASSRGGRQRVERPCSAARAALKDGYRELGNRVNTIDWEEGADKRGAQS